MHPPSRVSPLLAFALLFAVGAGVGMAWPEAGWGYFLGAVVALGAWVGIIGERGAGLDAGSGGAVNQEFEANAENASLPPSRAKLFLLILATAAGALHASTYMTAIPVDDVRRLSPTQREDPRSRWQGLIVSEPTWRSWKGEPPPMPENPAAKADAEEDGEPPPPPPMRTRAPGPGSRSPGVPLAPTRGSSTFWLEVEQGQAGDPEGEGATPRAMSGRIAVTLFSSLPEDWSYGDRVEVTGPLTAPEPVRNPGEFPTAQYLGRYDIHYELRGASRLTKLLAKDQGSTWIALSARVRDAALAALGWGIEDDPATTGLLGGMLLGSRQRVPPEWARAFQETGAYHIFAVSGQNLSLTLAAGIVFLQVLGLVRWRWAIVLLPLALFFCLMTGSAASALRALVMAGLVLIGWRFGRPADITAIWSIAWIALLVVDPFYLLDVGFQFTFAVVLALVLMTPGLTERWERPWRPDPFIPTELVTEAQWRIARLGRLAAATAATAIAAWLGSAPMLAYHYHQVVPVALLVNVPVVALAGLVVTTGTLSMTVAIFGWVGHAIAATFNNANWLWASILVWLVTACAAIPGGHFFIPSFDPGVTWRPVAPELVLLDLGAGVSCAILRQGNEACLLNCGSPESWQRVVDPARRYYGINRWTAVFLTEANEAHAGAAAEIAQQMPVEKWILPPIRPIRSITVNADLELLRAAGAKMTPWQRGDSWTWHGVTITALAPQSDPALSTPRRAEDRGLILRLTYEGRSVIWAGRPGFGIEQRLVRAEDAATPLAAEVLVQTLNIGEPNFTDAWCTAIHPSLVLVPEPNRYRRYQEDVSDLWPRDLPRPPRLLPQGHFGSLRLVWPTRSGEAFRVFDCHNREITGGR